MSVAPLLFLGHVMHRRLRPVVNAFVYPVFYVQLPLRHLAAANCSIFSVERANLLSFRQKDHGPRDGRPLLPWIEGLLCEHGLPDDGEIMLQTFPRVCGLHFNPVSFWHCYDRAGQLLGSQPREAATSHCDGRSASGDDDGKEVLSQVVGLSYRGRLAVPAIGLA